MLAINTIFYNSQLVHLASAAVEGASQVSLAMGTISAPDQLLQDARTSTCHGLREKELKHNTAQGWGWTAHTDTHSSTHTHVCTHTTLTG